MRDNELTDAELALIETLPTLPSMANVQTTNVWIIEWLSSDERHTGRELHEWMAAQRPGWSMYCRCESKEQVIQSIEHARRRCIQQPGMIPILHIEAHGSNAGLAPSNNNHTDWLSWEELTIPLQQLNLATRCNLVVVIAACVGFAAIQALRQGPRAPAVALVGPDAMVKPNNLLWGTKEFYRRWSDMNTTLADIAVSASREAGTTNFEWESFGTLCYEAMVEALVKSTRPIERRRTINKLRQRMLKETEFTISEIDDRLSNLPLISPWNELQKEWDQMFMIDIYPGNKERFNLDMKKVVEHIENMRLGESG